MQIRFLTILLLYLTPTLLEQLPLDLPLPTYGPYKKPLTIATVDDNKILSIIFGNIGYEISAEFYLQDGVLGDEEVFQPQQYLIAPEEYCQLYSTNTEIIDRTSIPFSHDTAPLKYLINHEQKQSSAYLLSSNSILYRYRFDKITMSIIEQYQLNSTITGIVDEQLIDNIEMVLVQDVLFIINANDSYIVYQGNILEHVGKVVGYDGVDRVVGVGAHDDMLWVCSANSLYVYQVVFDDTTSQKKATFVLKSVYENITINTISAVNYDATVNEFYIVAAHKFIILQHTTTKQSSPITKSYQINGNCQKIRKIKDIVYLMCQYQKLNFVTEILLMPNPDKNSNDASTTNSTAILNRYYDQSMLQGIRDVKSLGLDKILLIGDEEVVLIGQAVNRNVLLNLQRFKKQQYYQVMSSFGLIDIFYLPYYSTASQATILLINDNQVRIISILYDPPEIQCVLDREQFGTTASLLVVFNTTYCPSAVTTQFQQVVHQSPTLSLCQIYYPIKINIAIKQYERKSAFFILFLAIVFMAALILVFIGFGIKIRRKANEMILSIQAKIKKLQESGKKKKKVQKI